MEKTESINRKLLEIAEKVLRHGEEQVRISLKACHRAEYIGCIDKTPEKFLSLLALQVERLEIVISTYDALIENYDGLQSELRAVVRHANYRDLLFQKKRVKLIELGELKKLL